MEDLTKQLADLEAQIDGISKKFEVAATADEVKAVKKNFRPAQTAQRPERYSAKSNRQTH